MSYRPQNPKAVISSNQRTGGTIGKEHCLPFGALVYATPLDLSCSRCLFLGGRRELRRQSAETNPHGRPERNRCGQQCLCNEFLCPTGQATRQSLLLTRQHIGGTGDDLCRRSRRDGQGNGVHAALHPRATTTS